MQFLVTVVAPQVEAPALHTESPPKTEVIFERPQGYWAQGSYVWPAWAVVAVAIGATGLLLWVGWKRRQGRFLKL